LLNVQAIDSEGSDEGKDKSNRTYLIHLNLVETLNKKTLKGMRVMIDLTKEDSVENMDLLKCMLWGNSNLVRMFKRIEYVNTPVEDSNKTVKETNSKN